MAFSSSAGCTSSYFSYSSSNAVSLSSPSSSLSYTGWSSSSFPSSSFVHNEQPFLVPSTFLQPNEEAEKIASLQRANVSSCPSSSSSSSSSDVSSCSIEDIIGTIIRALLTSKHLRLLSDESPPTEVVENVCQELLSVLVTELPKKATNQNVTSPEENIFVAEGSKEEDLFISGKETYSLPSVGNRQEEIAKEKNTHNLTEEESETTGAGIIQENKEDAARDEDSQKKELKKVDKEGKEGQAEKKEKQETEEKDSTLKKDVKLYGNKVPNTTQGASASSTVFSSSQNSLLLSSSSSVYSSSIPSVISLSQSSSCSSFSKIVPVCSTLSSSSPAFSFSASSSTFSPSSLSARSPTFYSSKAISSSSSCASFFPSSSCSAFSSLTACPSSFSSSSFSSSLFIPPTSQMARNNFFDNGTATYSKSSFVPMNIHNNNNYSFAGNRNNNEDRHNNNDMSYPSCMDVNNFYLNANNNNDSNNEDCNNNSSLFPMYNDNNNNNCNVLFAANENNNVDNTNGNSGMNSMVNEVYLHSQQDMKDNSYASSSYVDATDVNLTGLCDIEEYKRRLDGRPMPSTKVNESLVPINAEIRYEMHIRKFCMLMTNTDFNKNTSVVLPREIDDRYFCFCLLDDEKKSAHSEYFGMASYVYKALCIDDNCAYELRRFDQNFLVNRFHQIKLKAQKWINLEGHPCVVALRDVFTTSEFWNMKKNSSLNSKNKSLIFVYDFYPNAVTLEHLHFKKQKPVDESLLWAYITQLLSALVYIHSNGLAARISHPSKILVSYSNRIRLSGIGILEIIKTDVYSSSSTLLYLQRLDLNFLGQIILALACGSMQAFKDIDNFLHYVFPKSLYSDELKNLVFTLLAEPSEYAMDIFGIQQMICSKMNTLLEHSLNTTDMLEGELQNEVENGRLFRVMCKINTITDRLEMCGDKNWAETAERYIVKLFKYYVFHQIDEHSRPILDMGHVVDSLNKVDVGTTEKILLMSNDGASILIVTFAEVKRCIEKSFTEMVAAATSQA